MKFRYHWWGKGDIDASFGVFFDGFSKILSATGIMLFVFGMPANIVLGKIVPGIGLAIFAGNLWYFYEARSLAKKENRQNVTAQPFGIGASQLTGWLYLIMGPVYWQTGDAELAFQIGLAAALIGGFVEVLGGFIGRWLVSVIPHSALMGNMASSAIVWLSFVGIAMVFDRPVYALLPLFIIIIDYLGKADKRFQKIPSGLVAIVLGAAIAWGTGYLTPDNFTSAFSNLGFYPPTFCGIDIAKGFSGIFPFLPIIIPLQINNFLSTLQGVESAKSARRCLSGKEIYDYGRMLYYIRFFIRKSVSNYCLFRSSRLEGAGSKGWFLFGQCLCLPADLYDWLDRCSYGAHSYRGCYGTAYFCRPVCYGKHFPGVGQKVYQCSSFVVNSDFIPIYPNADQLCGSSGWDYGGGYWSFKICRIFSTHYGNPIFRKRRVFVQPFAGGVVSLYRG